MFEFGTTVRVVEVEPGCEALSHGLGRESPGLGGVELVACCASAVRFLSHGLGGAGRPEIGFEIFREQIRCAINHSISNLNINIILLKVGSYLTCPFNHLIRIRTT